MAPWALDLAELKPTNDEIYALKWNEKIQKERKSRRREKHNATHQVKPFIPLKKPNYIEFQVTFDLSSLIH